MKIFIILLAIVVLLISGCITKSERKADMNKSNETIDLIPRKVLFGNPDRAAARISLDGLNISFLAPVNGVLNVWVGPVYDIDKAKPVTNDTYRGIRSYAWTYTKDRILYLQDKNGDENWRIYGVNLTTGETTDFTPFEGVQARIDAVSYKRPQEIVIGLNKRDPQYHDLYLLNVETGNLTLIEENKEFSGFDIDDEYNVILASKTTDDGGFDIFKASGDGNWEPFIKVGMEDALATGTLGFGKTNDTLYFKDSRGRDTAALYELNLTTNENELVAEDPQVDLGGLMIHPTEKNIQAVGFAFDRLKWTAIDPAITKDIEYLNSLEEGQMVVVARTLDDKKWIVVFDVDNGPARYYLYDRDSGMAKFLFVDISQLEGKSMAKMTSEVIKSRDNLSLVSYLTLPVGSDSNQDGRPDEPLPMVLLVHGGPWARDMWGFNPIHQWLANRGYAVLSVNFRGSTGFGKNFANAGNLEWGRKMQDDLLDAVNWSIKERIADPRKVAIMGGSYGGYATLAGLTFSPDFFACGVDMVGPSNLITLLESIPPYWKPELETFTTRVGDYRTEEGRSLLNDRSPLNRATNIRKPLLIAQGANDPRVKQNESDQIVHAMGEHGIPVTYVIYSDEGHGFARPENRLSFFAVTEGFLADNLGGRFEGVDDDFNGSTVSVPVGAQYVSGLNEALAARNDSVKRE
jgi:dipeptidyl aminopeptidase/acylaminoacyl peptidase